MVVNPKKAAAAKKRRRVLAKRVKNLQAELDDVMGQIVDIEEGQEGGSSSSTSKLRRPTPGRRSSRSPIAGYVGRIFTRFNPALPTTPRSADTNGRVP